jgi:hypothetical protein
MYKLTIYIDDPDIEPITITTPTAHIDMKDIAQSGCFDEKTNTMYPPHRIKKIRREVVL